MFIVLTCVDVCWRVLTGVLMNEGVVRADVGAVKCFSFSCFK